MELFNKGERTISGLKPQTSAVFDDVTAAKLLKMYGHELVQASTAQVISSDDDIQAYVDKIESENKQLLKEVEDLQEEVKKLQEGDKTKLKKQVKDLQEEVGKLKLELSTKSEDEPSFPE